MPLEVDLFGLATGPLLDPRVSKFGKRRKGVPNGYARRPGSGPVGETCGTCANCVRVNGGNRDYLKCKVIEFRWTHGPGTDILKKSPACELWKADAP